MVGARSVAKRKTRVRMLRSEPASTDNCELTGLLFVSAFWAADLLAAFRALNRATGAPFAGR